MIYVRRTCWNLKPSHMLFPRVKNFVFCRQGELKEWQGASLWGLGVKRGTKINSGPGSHRQHHHYKKWRQETFSSLWRDARYVLEAVGACLGSCRCHMQVIESGDCGVPSTHGTHARKDTQEPQDSGCCRYFVYLWIQPLLVQFGHKT